MCVTICGRFCPEEGAVAGYGNRIRAKYTAKWGVQIAGMIFQTGSRIQALEYVPQFQVPVQLSRISQPTNFIVYTFSQETQVFFVQFIFFLDLQLNFIELKICIYFVG